MTWIATAEGLTVRLTYAQVSDRIQSTPPRERKLLACGSLQLGAWTVRRAT